MIYCVIPKELEGDFEDKMVEYYKDNPNVTVIVDRREGPDRRDKRTDAEFKEQREIRDRRRSPRDRDFPGHCRAAGLDPSLRSPSWRPQPLTH